MLSLLPALPVIASILSSSSSANAHIVARGCGGHDLHYPVGRMEMAARAIPTDLASSEANTTPEDQCQPYNYQPVTDLAPRYPKIWETAYIVDGDETARALFATINATINEKLPGATQKPASGTQGYNYDRSDPDCWWTWQGCTTPNPSLGLSNDIIRVPEPQTLALTIDDGPNCSQNAFYDFLKTQNQKISTYVIGSNVYVWPYQAIRIHEDGHEMAVHTWSHQPMTSLTNEQVFAELYYTRELIKDIVGITPKTWRPPQGDVDNRVRFVAQGLNLTCILWTDDSDDWRAQVPNSGVTPDIVDKNYQAVIDQAKSGNFSTQGGVFLSHQNSNYTMENLIKWIPQFKNAFTHLVPLAVAMNWTQPYVELNETFQDFNQYINNQPASDAPSTTITDGSSTVTSAIGTGTIQASGGSSSGSASNRASAGASSGAAGRKAGQGWEMLAVGALVGAIGMAVGMSLII